MGTGGIKMDAGVRTHICEPNSFARQWMAMLVVRDWHTQLVGESSSLDALISIAEKQSFSILVLDTSMCQHQRAMTNLGQILLRKRKPPKILWVGKPDFYITKVELPLSLIAGYLMPEQIHFSLAWAVYFASRGNVVITPAGREFMPYWDRFSDSPLYELEGRYVLDRHKLSQKDKEMIRLAFLFSAERADLDEETNVEQNTPQMQISRLYEKIDLTDLPDDPAEVELFFHQDEVVLEHYRDILAKRKGKLKKGNESLAYHVLSRPDITLIREKFESN